MNAEQLLDKLEESLISTEIPIEDSLRIALLLADELDASDMVAWCRHELLGYESNVPEYRKVGRRLIGDSVSANHQFTNHPIELALVENEEVFQTLLDSQSLSLEGPIAEIRNWIGQESIHMPLLPPEFIRFLSPRSPGMRLFNVRWQLGRSQIVGFIDVVKTRLVELVAAFKRLKREDGLNNIAPGEANTVFKNCVIENVYLSQDYISVTATEGSKAVGKQTSAGDASVSQAGSVNVDTSKNDLDLKTQIVLLLFRKLGMGR